MTKHDSLFFLNFLDLIQDKGRRTRKVLATVSRKGDLYFLDVSHPVIAAHCNFLKKATEEHGMLA